MPAFEDLFKMELFNKQMQKVSGEDALKGKVILLYFSAHWCPPCRQFTPVLAKFYDQAVAEGKNIACVFVSSDQDENAMKDYFTKEHGNYYALPHGHELADFLSGKYGVRGIPTLMVVKQNGDIIEANGRGQVTSAKTEVCDEWAKAL